MPEALWRRTQKCVAFWRSLGASPFLSRQIEFGINDPPVVPFSVGEMLGEIPQSEEDLAFGLEDLDRGCKEGIYKEVSSEHVCAAVARGNMLSSSFVIWQDGSEGRKGRFIVNLAKQSKHWEKGSVRMETLPAYALELQKSDHMVSFDIQSGYRHFRLAPSMRDMFLFRYAGRFYQCVALPFGWGRSPMWFTRLLRPVVQHLRTNEHYRVLAYLDDFLVAPSPAGKVAGSSACRAATGRIDKLLEHLGLVRHPSKGEWVGSTRVEHLGVVIDTELEKFFIAPRKIEKIRKMAGQLLTESRHGRRWVSVKRMRTFIGTCVSLTLAMPYARFYTRSLYWDLANAQQPTGSKAKLFEGCVASGEGPRKERTLPRAARGGDRCKLSHQGIRDIQSWRALTSTEREGRPLRPAAPELMMHTDAADLGYGGTLGKCGAAGQCGEWEAQGVWGWHERAESISYRELKAIRLLLTRAENSGSRSFGARLLDAGIRNLQLQCDNMAAVHVTNAMVSASRPMMRELRLLKRELDRLGLHLDARWLPSALNKYADALSRRFPSGDLQIRRSLRHSVMDGMKAPADVFPYRPLGEHPVFLRRQCFLEMRQPWYPTDATRLLCPPVDLIAPVLQKARLSGCPAVLLIPDWPHQQWHSTALQMATHAFLLPYAPQQIWTAARTMNPSWKLLLVEVNMPPDPERWARQRDLVLRPPAPSRQEARPTANL
jgi:hypothetical protein